MGTLQGRGFLFDLDGTIIDSTHLHHQAWGAALSEFGCIVLDNELHREIAGRSNADVLRMFLGKGLTTAEITLYAERKEELYRSLAQSQLRLIKGVRRFLARSRIAGARLALATAADRQNIAFALTITGLLEAFEVVIGGDDITNPKPHPETFEQAAKALKVAPESCLAFEDTPVGIAAAFAAAMPVIAIASAHRPEVLAALPHVIRVVKDYSTLEPHDLVPLFHVGKEMDRYGSSTYI